MFRTAMQLICAAIVAAIVSLAGAGPAAADWDSVNVAPGHTIEGYASQVSVLPGDTLQLHVSTNPPESYRVQFYRVGWYPGSAPPLLACLPSCTGSEAGSAQPVPAPDPTTQEVDANWPVTDSFTIPSGWTSGYYAAQLVLTSGPDAGDQNIVPFIVRAPAGNCSSILVQASVNTWQAYNSWGGKSLYPAGANNPVPANHVTFDRPYLDPHEGGQSMFDWEVQLARFLERSGYDVTYTTDVDVAEDPSSLLCHRLVITSGHDEYWSQAQRNAFEAARDADPPVNLAFLSANTSYWQVRYEDDYRTIVGYKAYYVDPDPDPSEQTIRFRYLSPPRPECELMGVESQGALETTGSLNYYVNGAALSDPLFAGTGLTSGAELKALVGYEWDTLTPLCPVAGSTATPETVYFRTPSSTSQDHADAVGYTAPSGARVFSSGTFELSWALDSYGAAGCGSCSPTTTNSVDPRVQQFMRNLVNEYSGATPSAPAVYTLAPSHLTQTGGTLNATVNGEGQTATVSYQYGPTTTYGGSTPSTTVGAADDRGTHAVNIPISGLKPGTTYHCRAVATDTTGTTYGGDQQFTTPLYPPPTPAPGSYAAQVLGDGPVSYWPLNESSGTWASDATSTNPGTYVSVKLGAPGAVAGDTAATFNGSSSQVTIPDSSTLHTGDVFSIEAWVKPAALGVVNGIANRNGSFMLLLNTSNQIELSALVNNPGPIVTSSAPFPNTTQFHQVVMTKDGGNVHLYLDGVDVTGTVTNRTVFDAANPFLIGAGASHFHGSIGEVSLYKTALSATQVQNHYLAGIGRQVNPTPTTGSAGPVTQSTATLNGSVDPNGQASTYYFQYSPSSTFASEITTTPSQTTGTDSNNDPVSAAVAGLSPGTTYYFRLLAYNDSTPADPIPGATASFTTVAPPPPTVTYAQVVVGDTPISYWRLGEITGPTAADQQGANPGTYVGGVTLGSPGAVPGGRSATMDGTSGYVAVPYRAALNPATTWSLEAWVDPSSFSTVDAMSAVNSRTPSSVSHRGFDLGLSETSGTPYVEIGNGSRFAIVTAPTAAPRNVWTYLVATYDGSQVRLYADGALVAGPTAVSYAPNPTTPLDLGSMDNGQGQFFAGSLAEVAVYGTALSASQVSAHYAAAGAAPAAAATLSAGLESLASPARRWATRAEGLVSRLAAALGAHAVSRFGAYLPGSAR